MKLYAERDIVAQGEFYTRHVSAMTSEGLHEKSDIAAELAHRDERIEALEAEIEKHRGNARDLVAEVCEAERERDEREERIAALEAERDHLLDQSGRASVRAEQAEDRAEEAAGLLRDYDAAIERALIASGYPPPAVLDVQERARAWLEGKQEQADARVQGRREALESACDVARELGYATGHADNAGDLLREVEEQARERGRREEREARNHYEVAARGD